MEATKIVFTPFRSFFMLEKTPSITVASINLSPLKDESFIRMLIATELYVFLNAFHLITNYKKNKIFKFVISDHQQLFIIFICCRCSEIKPFLVLFFG